MIEKNSSVKFDFWACQRPLTHHWGSGQVEKRLVKDFGQIDVAFGKQDQISEGITTIDSDASVNPTVIADWKKLPFEDNHFNFGYWDPPYDKLYKKEGMEIWRVCKRLAILHTFIFPRAWLKEGVREGMIAITMGPLKQIRCLQIFRKNILFEALKNCTSKTKQEKA